MKWYNFFRTFVHCYDPVDINGQTVYLNMQIMYPLQSFFYDLKRYGYLTAKENFIRTMEQ